MKSILGMNVLSGPLEPVRWQQQAVGGKTTKERTVESEARTTCPLSPEAVLAETRPWKAPFYLNKESLQSLSLGNNILLAGRNTSSPASLEAELLLHVSVPRTVPTGPRASPPWLEKQNSTDLRLWARTSE